MIPYDNVLTESPGTDGSTAPTVPEKDRGNGGERGAAAMRLRRLSAGHWISQSLRAVAELGIADQLKDAPKSLRCLARSVGANPRALYRVLRALAALDVFQETAPGFFGLTEAGKLLISGVPGSLRPLALWNGGITYRAWEDVVRSVETGESALQRTLGQGLFPYLEAHPATAAVFHGAMAGIAAHTASAVSDACDFSNSRVIVDLGGGSGRLIAAILNANPKAHGILFDSRSAINGARELLRAAGSLDRCELVAGDFFVSVPAQGDTYILSSILHDWSDRDCLRILENCRKAMPSDGRLLVIETVIDSADRECFTTLLDLQMLVITGGRERTFDGYRNLLQRAGFQVLRTFRTAFAESALESTPETRSE
jgi:hypothetical protein